MNTLKTYDKFNESLYGELSRLNPVRYDNDVKIAEIFEEMKDDFQKYGRDLKKVGIIDHKGKILSFDNLEIGISGKLTYIFGKYHPVTNNIYTGNERAGNRKIEISYIPFEIVFRKNELEKMFKTSRVNLPRVRVKETIIKNNLEYNPNVSSNYGLFERPSESDRKKMVRFDTKENEFKVSTDIAAKIYRYFIKEYEKQHPKLKVDKNPFGVMDIEKGVEPVAKKINVKSKDGKVINYSLRYGEDENEIRKLLSNMTEKEYEKDFYFKRQSELYKVSSEKSKKQKEEMEDEINRLLKKYKIVVKKDKYNKFNRYGFTLKSFIPNYSAIIEFGLNTEDDKELEKKVKQLINDDFFKERYDEIDYHLNKMTPKEHSWIKETRCYVMIGLDNNR